MIKLNEKEESLKPKITLTKGSDYKVVYVTGAFGGLNPVEGRIIFYLDRIVPKIKPEPTGAMEMGEIERELQIEIHMSPATWISIAEWMQEHINRLKEKGILITKEKIMVE